MKTMHLPVFYLEEGLDQSVIEIMQDFRDNNTWFSDLPNKNNEYTDVINTTKDAVIQASKDFGYDVTSRLPLEKNILLLDGNDYRSVMDSLKRDTDTTGYYSSVKYKLFVNLSDGINLNQNRSREAITKTLIHELWHSGAYVLLSLYKKDNVIFPKRYGLSESKGVHQRQRGLSYIEEGLIEIMTYYIIKNLHKKYSLISDIFHTRDQNRIINYYGAVIILDVVFIAVSEQTDHAYKDLLKLLLGDFLTGSRDSVNILSQQFGKEAVEYLLNIKDTVEYYKLHEVFGRLGLNKQAENWRNEEYMRNYDYCEFI